MKRCILLTTLCIGMAVLLPMLFFSGVRPEKTVPVAAVPHAAADQPRAMAVAAELAVSGISPVEKSRPPQPDAGLTFSFRCDGQTSEITMAEYLPGVLAGEMPATFEPEALRAQAVAARTFVLYHLSRTNPNHPEAAICDDPACCQVWLSEEAREKSWGSAADACRERIAAAVEDTDGLYLTYDNEPILACFHSSSNRYTESCGVIWGTALPYLTSVPSPEKEADVPNYVTQVEIAPEELRDTVAAAFPEADFSALPETWLGVSSLDTSGRVSHLELGGVTIPGTKLRSLFSLRSTSFTAEWTGHSFLFTVTGFGHGAGMSQYGANVMAQQGSDFESILCHYYQGAVLASY